MSPVCQPLAADDLDVTPTQPRTKPNLRIAAIAARRAARVRARFAAPPAPSPKRASGKAQAKVAPSAPTMPRAGANDPRSGLIAALTAAVRDATACGDLAAARVALDALNRLLAGAPAPSDGGRC